MISHIITVLLIQPLPGKIVCLILRNASLENKQNYDGTRMLLKVPLTFMISEILYQI